MIFIFSTSFSSLARSSENYEECIFNNIKGVGSDIWATEIIDLSKAKHLREGNYKDGKRDGKWTTWYENGQIKSEEYYKDGERDGKWTTWYETGQIKSEISFKDGNSTTWHKNGQIMSEKSIEDGGFVNRTIYHYFDNDKMREV